MRILSTNFFKDISEIDKVYNPGCSDWQEELGAYQIKTTLQGAPDMLENAEFGFIKDNKPWIGLFKQALDMLPTVCEEYNVEADTLDDIWMSFLKDTWDLDNPTITERSNSDVHLDYFDDYTTIINLQIYMSDNTPPEAGTCFWTHTGETKDLKPIGDHGESLDIPGEWRFREQVPFARNTAFLYNAGPGGEYHSAPLTEDLIEKEVPSHERIVIIVRYRFK